MMKAPFKGLRVIELASVLAGPAVGMFFAELGAEVVKVENFRLGGDVTRTWKLPSESADTDVPAYFSSVNWGKKSVGIDLGGTAGRELVHLLLEKADLVLISFKPGDAARFGMDGPSLMARHPRLICGEITAYGADDARVGYDAIIQAETGFTYMNGTPESGPVKMPVALMDLLTAHQLKEGLLVALWQRERSGKGAHVQASLVKSGIGSLANQALNWLKGGHIPQRMGSGHPNIVPYGDIFATRDGKAIVLAVGNDKQFTHLCGILGFPAWAQRSEFATNAERVRNRDLVKTELATAILNHDLGNLLASCHAQQVPAGAVQDMQAVFEMEAAREMLFHEGRERGLRTVAFGSPEWDTQLPLGAPPHLCLHTVEVFAAAGLSADQMDRHKEDGVIR